jgi:hydroxymethylglutaryl-CoA lyase
LDCGSFVNPESIPQMADTAEVIQAISEVDTNTELLVIVANERGALRAVAYPKIKYLGFPLSVSETFQKRNTNASREEAFRRLARIQDIAVASGKEVVAYLSMAFGNPYGDEWSSKEVAEWASKIASLGIRIISLSDTVGTANAEQLGDLFSEIHDRLPHVEVGVHLHAKPNEWLAKVEAAYNHGCRRFDAALGGFGGCPMAKDDLVGNIPSEGAFSWLSQQEPAGLTMKIQWDELRLLAQETYTFGTY